MTATRPDRFRNRVADYVRYRPDYAEAAIEHVIAELRLAPGRTVADIGAGTGILTRQLLRSGASFIAIDPSDAMLGAAEDLRGAGVELRIGTAEETGLADASVDAVVAGQAFHWFEPVGAQRELRRILRPGGRVALLWNEKDWSRSGFLRAYEELLETTIPEFSQVRHETTGDAEIEAFFAGGFEVQRFEHEQRFDWEGVLGRALSSSYAPASGHPGHDAFVAALRELFDAHAEDGELAWPYTTAVYIGSLG